MTNVLIWDEDGDSSSSLDTTVLWRAFSSEHNSSVISVPELVELYGFELRKNYLSFVHSTGSLEIYGKPLRDYFQLNNGVNLWWSSLISEKANWSKSPEIYTIIRILAFTKWSETNQITTLTLATSDKILASAFKLWCSRRNITFSLILSSSRIIPILTTKQIIGHLPFLSKLLFGFFAISSNDGLSKA